MNFFYWTIAIAFAKSYPVTTAHWEYQQLKFIVHCVSLKSWSVYVGVFADRTILQFSENPFVRDWLTGQVKLDTLFNLVYNTDGKFEIRQLQLVDLQCIFEFPAFETLRLHRTDERTAPTPERTKIEGTWPRRGRLEWVDIFLSLSLHALVAPLESQVERITSTSFEQKLGDLASLDELKVKLTNLYGPSVVSAFFHKIQISSIEEFRKLSPQFLEFVGKPLPIFGENVPACNKNFPLNVCVVIRETLDFREALRSAKLCREILENEGDHMGTIGGAEVITPYAFVVIFPKVSVTDQSIPGETVSTVKEKVASIYQSENMLSFFL